MYVYVYLCMHAHVQAPECFFERVRKRVREGDSVVTGTVDNNKTDAFNLSVKFAGNLNWVTLPQTRPAMQPAEIQSEF